MCTAHHSARCNALIIFLNCKHALAYRNAGVAVVNSEVVGLAPGLAPVLCAFKRRLAIMEDKDKLQVAPKYIIKSVTLRRPPRSQTFNDFQNMFLPN
jgi:hypothetical protein